MSSVVVAKDPNLKFLNTSRRIDQNNDCPLPMILKKGGKFDWDANSFITHYGGGSQTYNIRPLAKTVQKKAYSLNLFCDFLEDNSINLSEINDSTLYQYIKESKDRNIKDGTIIQHGRTAIEYIDYLSKMYPEWKLGTTGKDSDKIFSVHYEKLKFKKGSITGEYFYHESLVGLINIASEVEYVHDHELVMWLDAINCTTNHPRINTFLISRWEALTTLLDITGSRISEAHEITRTMIKKAADSLLISDKQPIIRNIPIRKGKYKGKTRSVKTTHEDIQVILLYVHIIEDMFPDMEHDALFVDSVTGKPLKSTYLKNYAKKVINGSKYCEALKHLTNHSFRHRFITLNIAKAIKKISAQGSFSSILSVASNACRKVTMHANNESMSHYVHLATEYNEKNDQGDIDMSNISPQIRIRVKKLISIVNLFRLKEINEAEALDSLLSTINEFKKFT